MSKIPIYVLVVLLTTVVFDTSICDGQKDREPGYCHYEGIDVKEGEVVPAPVGKCHKIKCLDASKNSAGALSCAPFALPADSKCHISDQDLTKPYPECCPRAICPDDE